MSTKINDGGPAFPSCVMPQYNEGMTLRDWFAGQALNGILSDAKNIRAAHEASKGDGVDAGVFIARSAYDFADDLLAERNKASK